jgi:hypothetical protein
MLHHRNKQAIANFLFFIYCILAGTCPAWSYPAGQAWNSEQLFSPSVSRTFYEIAYELANAETPTPAQAGQAIAFFNAAMALDRQTSYVLPDLLKLTTSLHSSAYSESVSQLLGSYVDESADLEVATKAVQYLLEQLDSREQREKLLEQLSQNIAGKNPVWDSELYTQLGLLAAEKADANAAELYFNLALDNNKFNRLAFDKLLELRPQRISTTMYLQHLRLMLRENPYDIEAALAFAQYAEQLQLYELAANSYKYSADLFGFLYPSEPLPSWIYLPWAISSYNAPRDLHRCLQIAEQLRQQGRFDLLAEAIAGKAAAKIGDMQLSNQILTAAETKALVQSVDNKPQPASYEQMAWFYCFALQDKDKALDWANKAYSAEPNSPTAAAILAYALVTNDQNDWARLLIDNYPTNPIASLASAQIQLQDARQKDSAIETLKSVIAKDPGALEAERARQLLAQYGSEYTSPLDPDITLMSLTSTFGPAILPAFIRPAQAISAQINIRGSKFPYGSDFGGSLVITNNSSEPVIISDYGFFRGNVRVDANVTGDLNKTFPNLVSMKIRPSQPIEPGTSLLVPLRLVTAELRQILFTYPQASLTIEFTAYLDPVFTDQGLIVSGLAINPVTTVVYRPAVELTAKFLQNRLNSLAKGKQGQKIRTAELFTGLLAEQQAMANREPLYKFMYADWMPPLLKSALINNLQTDDWVTRVHTMAGMLSLPLDYELLAAAADSLSETHWPARLMAISLLAKNQDDSFGRVLDHSARYDSNELVRNMAVALGAAAPKQQKQPQPESQQTNKSAGDANLPAVSVNQH